MVLRALYPPAPAAVSDVVVSGDHAAADAVAGLRDAAARERHDRARQEPGDLDIYRLARGAAPAGGHQDGPGLTAAHSPHGSLVGARSGAYVLVASTPLDRRTLAGAPAPLRVTV